MKIEELNKHGIPNEILNVWRKSGIGGTLPIQDRAIGAGLLKGKSLLLVAPTSSGKSFAGEMAAVAHAMQGRKTLYLVPFKAIEHNFKLIPIYVLAELYVRFREGKLTPDQIGHFLLNAKGYLNLAALEKCFQDVAKKAEAAK
ncbi:MAG: DEAD/DEAH box helicase [Verrucomicrobiia bacterium]